MAPNQKVKRLGLFFRDYTIHMHVALKEERCYETHMTILRDTHDDTTRHT